MALLSFTAAAATTAPSLTICNLTKHHTTTRNRLFLSSRIADSSSSFRNIVRCSSAAVPAAAPITSNETIVRRSANYPPTNWSYDLVKSLNTDFSVSHTKRISDQLTAHVMMLFVQAENSSADHDKLQLIATLQRLGIAYHFEDKIKTIFEDIYNLKYRHNVNTPKTDQDLASTALEFRLLREYGFEVPQEVFNNFKDEHGNFKQCICEDIDGVLSLYEASFLVEEGENILEDARDFTAKFLKSFIKENKGHEYHLMLASHALELPLRWRLMQLEARWFIDAYKKAKNMDPLLLEFAILNFNYVQTVHQKELKHLSTWWKNTGLGSQLSFIRDRVVESFFWAAGMAFHPELNYFREITTQDAQLITAVDDIYDVYGTLDELEQFTAAVERWDSCAIDHLPNYMQMTFIAVHNFVNDMGYHILKQQGVLIIPHLKQMWIDLCKSYLVEARWYHNGYTPTLQEYLDNAWISVGAAFMIIYGYYPCANPITEEAIEYLKDYPNITRWGAMLVRLVDDVGTFSYELKRGDVSKAVQCYMNETGASESDACEHMHYLINETWKKMNKDQRIAKSIFPHAFVDMAMNIARVAQCLYQYGDGFGNEDSRTTERMQSLFFESIPFVE